MSTDTSPVSTSGPSDADLPFRYGATLAADIERRWQDRWERPWKFVAHGCRCNRDTVAAIGASPLELGAVEHGVIPKAAPITRPLVVGTACRAA